MAGQPSFEGVYLFVEDMAASLAFYELLGLKIDRPTETFSTATMSNGTTVEFGTADLTRSYDPNWQHPSGSGTNTLNFGFDSPEAVDAMFERLTAAGYLGHLAPIDAFWGSRFAIVDDPDRNVVGLHGPRDKR